jgi:hypothetical protein
MTLVPVCAGGRSGAAAPRRMTNVDASLPRVDLAQLTADELDGLRLAAQVMAHRGAVARRPRVAMFFNGLESAAVAERAARGQPGRRPAGHPTTWLVTGATRADLRLIGDCLWLLADNLALPAAVRAVCHSLIRSQGLESGHVSQHRHSPPPG